MYAIYKQIYSGGHLYFSNWLHYKKDETPPAQARGVHSQSNFEIIFNEYYVKKFNFQNHLVCWRF